MQRKSGGSTAGVRLGEAHEQPRNDSSAHLCQPALCSKAASPSGDEAPPASEPTFYEAFEDLTGAS